MKKIFAVILFALAIAAPAQGYQISLTAKAGKDEIAKGETFSYTLSIIEEGEAGLPVRLVPPDFSGFNVTGEYSSQSTRIIDNKARTINEQEYRLSSELPGEHVIPPAKAVITDPKTGAESAVKSNPVKVTVMEKGPGILKGLEEDIRDIKAPRTFLEKIKIFFYIITALIIIGFFLVVWLIVHMARRGRSTGSRGNVQPATAVLGPKEEALKALDAAEVLKGDAKVFYSVVSEAIRRYLRAAYNIPATEATTAEIMEAVKSSTLPAPSRDRLREILQEADLVKFAKYAPTEEEKGKFTEKARTFIKEA